MKLAAQLFGGVLVIAMFAVGLIGSVLFLRLVYNEIKSRSTRSRALLLTAAIIIFTFIAVGNKSCERRLDQAAEDASEW